MNYHLETWYEDRRGVKKYRKTRTFRWREGAEFAEQQFLNTAGPIAPKGTYRMKPKSHITSIGEEF